MPGAVQLPSTPWERGLETPATPELDGRMGVVVPSLPGMRAALGTHPSPPNTPQEVVGGTSLLSDIILFVSLQPTWEASRRGRDGYTHLADGHTEAWEGRT